MISKSWWTLSKSLFTVLWWAASLNYRLRNGWSEKSIFMGVQMFGINTRVELGWSTGLRKLWSVVETHTNPFSHSRLRSHTPDTHAHSHSHRHTLTHTLSHYLHPHPEAFFVNLAFGLKGHQDILEGEEKQKSEPAREESRGRRGSLLSSSI